MPEKPLTFTLTWYGKLADMAGAFETRQTVSQEIKTGAALRAYLIDTHDWGTAALSDDVRLCLNDTLVSWEAPLEEGDRIGFLPPVGGG